MIPMVTGLNLSITATGVAYADDSLSTITPTGGDARLAVIRDEVRLALGGCRKGVRGIDRWVDLAVIEDLPTHARTAGFTGMVHGVVRALCLDVGVPYVLVPPAMVKKYATGRGNATKTDMRMALEQRADLDVRDDQVDAWWLRALGMDALGHPLVEVPKAHRATLDKITWPTREVTR